MSFNSKASLGAIIAALGFSLAGISGNAHGATLAEIKARGYIVVATEDDYPPFEFIKDGKPTGFDNEMVDALRKSVPFEVRHEILPFTGILAGVATGKYDIAITAATMTRERMQALDFATPIADASDYFVTRINDSSIHSTMDLGGKAIGVQAGSAQLAHLSQLKATLEKGGRQLGKVTEYASYPEAYQDLALGRTDAVVNTIVNLRALLIEKPNVFAMGKAVSARSVAAWPVKKNNTELLAFINEFVATQKANGSLAALQKKWFGQAFDLPVTFAPEF